jgi:hypothetical protein
VHVRAALGDLARDFNADARRARLVALVSPTCPSCLEGARLVAGALDDRPDADVAVLILWVRALPGDSAVAATEVAAAIFDKDCRVHHYWEERDGWSMAAAFHATLGLVPASVDQLAWDVYCWFAPERHWGVSGPPTPSAWAHNLREAGASPDAPRICGSLIVEWLRGTEST